MGMTNLEAGWAPINELNGSLRLDARDSSLNVLWYDVTTVQKAAGH
jgi:hypothetical protein